jgi:hypothetical protein
MELHPYSRQLDRKHLHAWLTAREMDGDTLLSQLPAQGFVAWQEGRPVAAGFLRRCEGGMGMLDSFVSDPNAPAADRHEALELLTQRVMKAAEDAGLSGLLATSQDENTIARAIRNGFVPTHFVLLGKSLR